MENDTVVSLPRPGGIVEEPNSEADWPLLCLLREGARRMLMQAIQAEIDAFIDSHADLVDDQGRRRPINFVARLRNGHAPERSIQTGIGPIEVQRPRVRDRGAENAAPTRFTSAVLPAYLRRTRNVEELLPWLYLKGRGLADEHQRWQGRDLSAKRYVYVGADGVYFSPRLEHERQCILVIIGADASGKKELLAIDDGFRESEQIYHAESRAGADEAFDRCLAKYGATYEKACACLAKDRTTLLAFYDFPAEHRQHVRRTTPIESTFATVRLRTSKTKGCLSRDTALAMVFKLVRSAERHWRRLNGTNRLGEIVEGRRRARQTQQGSRRRMTAIHKI
jgi:transposase-like protein